MGFKELSVRLPTDFSDELLRSTISKKLKIEHFTCQITNKSLDARKRKDIHWQIRVGVSSEEIQGGEIQLRPRLEISHSDHKEKIVVVGSGPAGFFSALVLQKAGFQTTILERGCDVKKRGEQIQRFEETGEFSPTGNYAYGEGGAGTFSDGKLTSRSKHISRERQFILDSYVRAGGPEEILYLAHPHLGSENLRTIVLNLREEFQALGGKILFETTMNDLVIENGSVRRVITSNGDMPADYIVIATGHSAYETYRMLIKQGVPFRAKNFAIGCRVEHPQELINLAQWGKRELPGVKAAEYRLTAHPDGFLPVYTFCMCPGGVIVPAMACEKHSLVNGMSFFQRNKKFANAGCVAAVNLETILGRNIGPLEALDWVSELEKRFFDFSDSYRAPFCTIQDFIKKTAPTKTRESSYPLGLVPAPLWEFLPAQISDSIREGLKAFSKKVKGFESGNIMGLESKTSAPIQVLRDKVGKCEGFDNLYIVGEGSGYAGGIISSGADGIKAAMDIINGRN